MDKLLTEEQIRNAERVLHKGDRVELIPVKGGVKVLRVRREEIKKAEKSDGKALTFDGHLW